MRQETPFERSGAKATLFRPAPAWGTRRTACVGHFDCDTPEAGAALLNDIAAHCLSMEDHGLIGPMDGDTWHSYRLVTESDGSPPFLLEPFTNPGVLKAFETAGFTPLSRYVSARAHLADLTSGEPARPDGITITPWDGNHAERLIQEVHALSLLAFRHNPFYVPLDHDAFQAMYEPLIPFLVPDLALTARDEAGTLQAYLFAIPDYSEASPQKTVILKTYASRVHGAGRALADHCHRAALALGYDEIIHALMHEDNASFASSTKFAARVFRRYALMGRELLP